MPTWIDFKELRSKLNFEAVLTHYGVAVKKNGVQHLGLCPLPGHQGSRNAQSFSANLEKGIFQCFVCRAKGNVLDFAVLMSGKSPEDGRELKKVAAELRARFLPNLPGQPGRGPKVNGDGASSSGQLELGVEINAPLDFELKDLDAKHHSLRWMSTATAEYFGIGVCGRGSLSGRIAIPLHDSEGRLIGYSGLVVDEASVSEKTPKYLFPAKRERRGKTLEFRKDILIYNGNRVKPGTDLVIVQEPPSVWWLYELGYPRAVALMDAECSAEQLELIVAAVVPEGRIWLMPNASPEGERLAQRLLMTLSMYRWVKWCKLPWEKCSTQLLSEEVKALLI